jgi:titin
LLTLAEAIVFISEKIKLYRHTNMRTAQIKLNFLLIFILAATSGFSTTYTVSNLLDNNTSTGVNQGDLRWCLNQVVTNAASGPHVINFNVSGTINSGSMYPAIPNITGGLTINGFTAPGWTLNPIVVIDGPGWGEGLTINASTATVIIQGLIFADYGNAGILVQNSSNVTIRGCWVGVNATPAASGSGNGAGIRLDNGDNCVIGGDLSVNPEYKVLITNKQDGIHMRNGSDYNTVYGAYIGTNVAGTAALSTLQNAAVYIQQSSQNVFGGTGNGRRNIFSRANYGILIENGTARRNRFYNNLIGTDINGTIALANSTNGVRIKDGCHNNEIGGRNAGEGNIISGNSQTAIYLESGNLDSTLISRNYIGLGSNGTTVIVNGTAQDHHGIQINTSDAHRNKILNNVIVTPNRGSGIYHDGGGFDSICYNYFGVDATGLTLVGIGSNTNQAGVIVNTGTGGSDIVFIGNVVAGSKGHGIEVRGGGGKNNYVFKGNIIGMNKDGLGSTFGNVWTGIYFHPGASSNLIIGGTTAADRNIISMNGRDGTTIGACASVNGLGICIENVNGVTIQGNYIGVDATGLVARGNGNSGIMLNGGNSNVLIGGTAAGARNIISANGFNCTDGTAPNARHGVQFVNANGTNNRVEGNYVGLGIDGTTLLGNSEEGVSTWVASNVTVGGATAAHRNVIAGSRKGVYFQPNSSTNNRIEGNYIGTDYTGTVAKPCSIGIHLRGAPGINIINNVVSGNTSHGMLLQDGDNAVIQQNYIGLRSDGFLPLANGGDGIRLTQDGTNGTVDVLIGSGTNSALRNIIAYNANGVNITESNSFRNQIRRNSIYCNGSARQNGINLNGVGNTNIQINPLISTAPYITAPTPGINGTFTNQAGLAGTDVIEVFWDDACGTCQGKTYLGDATSLNSPAAGDWSYSPLPAASDCSPKGVAGCLVGVTNITATRTSSVGNTSEFMSCDPVFLPVRLTSFRVSHYGKDKALLEWTTSMEENNAYFEILRSIDGITFIPVGIVQGAGTTNDIQKYSFIDEGLVGGTYYYMLNQIDFDGTNHLTDVRSIQFELSNAIDVIPSVVNTGQSLRIVNSSGEEIKFSLLDVSGKVLINGVVVKNSSYQEIDTQGLSAGSYIVRIVSGENAATKKIVVY